MLFLCNHILGYEDVSLKVHGPILKALQKFKGGTEEYKTLPDGKFGLVAGSYKPACDMWQLEGCRNIGVFYPRGHLKTTVITFAHMIQWIINYPNVRIILGTATDTQAKQFLVGIKRNFTQNETFRYYFPEFCPTLRNKNGKLEDFGNQEQFTVPNRTSTKDKEPTISTNTVGSVIASGHYDVGIFDDMVDKENVLTPGSIQAVKDHFAATDPLIERRQAPKNWPAEKPWNNRGWTYLTGTFYDSSDLNFTIYDDEYNKPKDKRSWEIVCMSAAPDYPRSPTLWPERWPIAELQKIEHNPAFGPGVLASQYLMNPVPPGAGLVESNKEIVWTPRQALSEQIYPRLTLYASVDLAGMEPAQKDSENDYTAITLGGFGTDGHLYVVECIHGRSLQPADVIRELFALKQRHPRLLQIKIEKEAHARVLLPFLKAEEVRRGYFLPILEIKRDNRESKKHKIKGLQPWFKRGMIHFADDLPCKVHIMAEIMRFPRYSHDDILDSLCDLMATADGGITNEVMGVPTAETERKLYATAADGTTFWRNPMPAAVSMAVIQKQMQDIERGYDSITGF